MMLEEWLSINALSPVPWEAAAATKTAKLRNLKDIAARSRDSSLPTRRLFLWSINLLGKIAFLLLFVFLTPGQCNGGLPAAAKLSMSGWLMLDDCKSCKCNESCAHAALLWDRIFHCVRKKYFEFICAVVPLDAHFI